MSSVTTTAGRRATVLVVAFAFLALAAALFLGRRALLESWHLRRLGSTDAAVVERAAAALGRLRSRRAVEPLLALSVAPLEAVRKDWEDRVEDEIPALPPAARAVVEIGERAIPDLSRVLVDAEEKRPRRRTAAWLLGAIGGAAMPRLGDLLEHADAQVRIYALHALSFVDDAKLTIAPIRKALADPHPHIRRYVLVQFARFPALEGPLLPDFLDRLTDEDEIVRRAAEGRLRGYLFALPDTEGLSVFTRALRARSAEIRLRVVELIEEMASGEPPHLLRILAARDDDPAVRAAAARVAAALEEKSGRTRGVFR